MRLNTHSGDWQLVRRFALEEIEAGRSLLESNLTPEMTQIERGKIAAFRRLLDEFEPTKTPETEDINYG